MDCPCPTDTPTPTLTPTPTNTPTPTPEPVNITLRGAVRVAPGDTSCAAVAASSDWVDGTIFQFSSAPAPVPTPQTQVAPNPIDFLNLPAGTYTLDPVQPDPSWVLANACYTINPGGTSGTGLSVSTNPGDTVNWDIGYTWGTGWVQTGGGDVYATGSITSHIPGGLIPREFNLDGSGNTPGVITYGTSYDFDSSSGFQGETFVSSRDWLANETYPSVDLYDMFYRKFNAPTATDNGLFADLSAVTKPASRATPYYISGANVITSGNWSVGDGERVIFLINGNLTITGNINITGVNGTGFVAFIVNGDIRVDPSVGGIFSSTTPNIEGVYITNPTGTFFSGTSGVGSERLVGNGMFIAGNFSLERDLDSVSHNVDYAAELFTYNPTLLVTMPDEMRDAPVAWQETEP